MIKEAIELAGYHPSRIKNPERLFLDPLFWQALGNAMEWSKESEYKCRRSPAYNWQTIKRSGWHAKWIEFIDHLASGKSAEEWFAELDKK